MSQAVAARIRKLAAVIAAEAERNPEFSAAIGEALDTGSRRAAPKSRGGRRNKGAFDPVDVLREHGETTLRDQMATLDIEALKDIVAENGMDQRRLAMKWKDRERLEELILTSSRTRMVRGDAFR